MKIRFAQDKDYAAIARLHRQTIRHVNSKDYPEDIIKVWSGRSKAARFRSNANICKRWVAVDKDKITGFCDHKLDGEFGALYVHKDFIGRGVGSKLYDTAENSMKKLGLNKITLEATLTAKDFYKKLGFKIIKKSFHKIKDKKLPVFLMSKKIV